MIQRPNERLNLKVLVVDDELGAPSADGRAARALVRELQGLGLEVVEAVSAEDGHSVVRSDSAIHAILMDWYLGGDKGHVEARRLLEFVRSRNDKIPIFLMAEREGASSIPIDVMEMVDEFIWTLDDTAAFVGGRVVAAVRRYMELMLPPLTAALMKFAQEYEYSWHTPGHAGGTAFLKSPVGRAFFDYFGENLLRSDLSISVGDLGDQMFAQLRESRQTHWLSEAFSTLPRPVMTPRAAYQHMVRGQIEHVALDQLADRVLATSVVPYPPGIPLLMPGEATGAADGPCLSYLRALSSWDRRFPGFGHDIHGVENRHGVYHVQCLKQGVGGSGSSA